LIQTGRSLFEDQRYEESIQALSAALLRPNTPKSDRVEVYRLLAYNYIVLSHREEAEAAVRGLYALQPDFALSASESPRFKEFFAEVKKKWEAEGKPGLVTEEAPAPKPVSIKHSSPAQHQQGQELRLTGELDDPGDRVGAVVLHYRSGTQGKFERLEARISNARFRTIIPGASVKPPLVEYYFEVLDDKGLPIASRGDAAAPLRVAVPAPQGGGLFSSPWFWTGTGAVVVGGVIAAVLLTRKSDDGGPTPTSRVIVTVGQ
jgi:tetratricopeptide (TPR) repeat protein